MHNHKRMETRCIVFSLEVEYETTPEILQRIPEIVKQIIEEQKNILFDRGNFASFGDFSLKFELLYHGSQ